jgi:hypothetical protein
MYGPCVLAARPSRRLPKLSPRRGLREPGAQHKRRRRLTAWQGLIAQMLSG